jgi:hypothetical protein
MMGDGRPNNALHRTAIELSAAPPVNATLGGAVPVISTFFGIVIRMFYREQGVPHFHAEHQGQQATFTFNGEVLAGSITSRTALRLIKE